MEESSSGSTGSLIADVYVTVENIVEGNGLNESYLSEQMVKDFGLIEFYFAFILLFIFFIFLITGKRF